MYFRFTIWHSPVTRGYGPMATAGNQPSSRQSAKRFGEAEKQIRRSKPRTPHPRAKSDCMTQSDLAIRLHEIWKDTQHEDWTFDASWVGKLEKGKVLVSYELASCVAKALDATPDERTLLMAAAGFNTFPEDVLENLAISVRDIQVKLGVFIDQVASGEREIEDLLYVVHTIKAVIQQELTTVIQRDIALKMQGGQPPEATSSEGES